MSFIIIIDCVPRYCVKYELSLYFEIGGSVTISKITNLPDTGKKSANSIPENAKTLFA